MEEEGGAWYALQVFHGREEVQSSHLSLQGWEVFLPRRYEERPDASGRVRRRLVPAVRNLLFVRCPSGGEPRLRSALQSSPYASRVYETLSGHWCRISSAEMSQLRAVSDPSYRDTLYVEADSPVARRGSLVRVVRGPFAGLEGRLVRYRKRSYVVLTLSALGVLVHVPKWYCRPMESGKD